MVQPDSNWQDDSENVPWSNKLIEPTLYVDEAENSTLNRFERLSPGEMTQIIHSFGSEITLVWNTLIVNETYIITSTINARRLNDSFIESDAIYETKWNIYTGLLEQETGIELYFGETQELNFSYHLENIPNNSVLSISNNPDSIKLDKSIILLSSIAVLVIAMVIIFIFIMKSKIY